jgi:hypothetical protein
MCSVLTLTRRLLPLLVAGLFASSAAALADVNLSIQADTMNVAPGDVGDAFDVLLTNTGPSSVNIAGFVFGLFTTDTDITFTEADVDTDVMPYIFAGDSFVQIVESTPVISLQLVSYPPLPAQILTASDLTYDDTNVAVGAGQSVDLGRVLFDVDSDPTAQTFTVSFIDTIDPPPQYLFNNLSDADGNAVDVDNLESADFSIQSQTVVPEPSAAALLMTVLMCLWMANRLVRARRTRATRP